MQSVLVGVLEWPDWRLPARFVTGFPIAGRMERTGVSDEADELALTAGAVAKGDHVAAGLKLRADLRQRRPQEEACFLWESVLSEHAKGKAEEPMTEAQVTAYFATYPLYFAIEQMTLAKRA